MSVRDRVLDGSLSLRRQWGHELGRAQIARSLSAGLLIYSLEIIVVVSLASFIFAGDPTRQPPAGISVIVLGDAALMLVVTLFSSYGGSVAIAQDAPSAVLALAAAGVLTALGPAAGPEQKFATLVVMIALSTLATALFFVLLGYFRLGGLVRFLPYPVMGGFLAGTGWLLAAGGLGVMARSSPVLQMLQPAAMARWLPGLALGAALLTVTVRVRSPLALPLTLVAGAALFYAVAWLLHVPFSRLSAEGWLLGALPSGGGSFRLALNPAYLAAAGWPAIRAQDGILAPVLVVSVVSFLLNASGVELIVRQDYDLNREMMVTGLANVCAGLLGGIAGYHAISLSSLNHATAGGRRLPGIIAALGLVATVVAGGRLFAYMPVMLVGGLLVFLGLALLYDWVYRAWFKFPRVEFVVILLIVAVIALRGFLAGIGVGLIVTVLLFVIDYSKVEVVRHQLTGASYRSRVTRPPDQRKVLAESGDQIHVLQLQGFIFFGTANRIFEGLRARIQRPDLAPLAYVAIDFAHVNGQDSTALLSFAKIKQLVPDAGITLVFSGMNPTVQQQFARSGFSAADGRLRIFADLDHAVEWCEDQILAACGVSRAERTLLDHLASLGIRGGAAESAVAAAAGTVLERLVGYLHRREVRRGEYLMRQDEPADCLFLVEKGRVSALLETPGREPVRLETMGGGRIVGEIGFYLGSRRTASVVADDPAVVYRLCRDELAHMEQADPEAAALFHRIVVHLLGERVTHLIRTVDALQD